ncbi:cadherin-like and PC-esterase domain-containing protein 1 [Ixodes scapularis]|uniref:cadherin-like and PC-esterase domain-containing protein 1 n=1 Tax=Ixodes scapularis TaxID=6945 RepID=UPI001C38697C|nr:cadherin-like and PC-esterase domain-containing protein 1 [Ixodes scapularis]
MLRQAEELRVCHSGHESGRWVLPCENCNIAETCFWNEARWMPVNCRYADIANLPLQDCLAGKKLLFVGDSTNRGMMYYVLMRLNGTLGEWHKSHGILLHRRNLNGGRTDAGFAYYPQFWLPTNRRPPLGATLRQLVNGMTPVENSARTVLVVGGVHWIGVKHLTSLAATLKSLNLGNVKVIVKTFGSGFHQKADGVHQVAMEDLQKMGNTNRDLIRRAKQLHMDVVDTYNMTSARYKDFMQGNCACHFHRVVSDSLSTYRIEGPVNQAYSDILLGRLCHKHLRR